MPDNIPNEFDIRMNYKPFTNIIENLQRDEMLIVYNVDGFKQQLKTIMYRHNDEFVLRSFDTYNVVIIVKP